MTDFFKNIKEIITNICLFLNEHEYKNIIIIFAVSLVFVLVLAIYKAFNETAKNKYNNYIEVFNGKMLLSKNRFDFGKKIRRLKALGVLEKYPSMDKPHYYILTHLAFGFVLTIILIGLSIITGFPLFFAILGFPFGWVLLDFYFRFKNRKDNEKMEEEILSISTILSCELRGGIYIGEALCECKNVITNERLKNALTVFDRHLKLKDMTLIEAVNDFNERFDNDEIDSLCMTIRQNEESGRVQDILQDLTKQIEDNKEMSYLRTKGRISRTMTYCMLVMFLDIMAYILYLFISNIFSLL